MQKKARKWVSLVGFVVMAATFAHAKGRRADYEDSPAYDPNRVQRGSPANPNPAFAPPRFNNERSFSSAAPTATSGTPQEKPPRRSTPANTNLQRDGSAVPGGMPMGDRPQPPPKAVPSAPDASEPPLPDYPTDDHTGKATEKLNNSAGQIAPPPAH